MHVADENSQNFEVQFCENSPRSHAHETLPLVGTADRFTDRPKSIAGRQKLHDCTVDSTLGVHMTRAISQKHEVQFFVRKRNFIFCNIVLPACPRRNDTFLVSLKADYQYGAVPIWPLCPQKLVLRVCSKTTKNPRY